MSTKTKKPQNPLWQTDKAERSSYYTYFFGQNMIYNMIAAYLTTFLLLIGVDPVKSAAVMLAVKVWDAVNDAIFGVIFDKIQFKSGKKYIPWLKIACALTPAATIAIFVIPSGASETVKLVWFAIAYIIWDTAYTLCDVPAFGIITSMTSNIEERNTILSLKGITAGIGSALTTVLVSVLISEFIGLGYGWVSIIVAVVAMATMIPICTKCQERNKTIDEEQFTALKEMGAIKVKSVDGSTADVSIVTQELNQMQTQTLVDYLYQTVLTICGMPSMSDGSTSDSSNNGAVLLRNGWQGAETRAKDSELMFKASENNVLKLVLRIIRDTQGLSDDIYKLRLKNIGLQFTRRNYENVQSKAQVLTSMLQQPKIHPRLAFQHSGLFTDPESASLSSKEYAEEQEKKALELAQSQSPENDVVEEDE